MADFDGEADPFDDRGKKDEATGGEDETIPLIPGGGGGGDTQVNLYGDQSGERETSFGEGGVTRLRIKVLKDQVDGLYTKLARHFNQIPVVHHDDMFEIRDRALYVRGAQVSD